MGVRISELPVQATPSLAALLALVQDDETFSATLESILAANGSVVVAGSSLTNKRACRVAATGNLTLSGTQTVDGVSSLNNGDRILAGKQTTAADRGIYIYDSADDWIRAEDFDSSADVISMCEIPVQEGTVNAGCVFQLTTTGAITLGSTALAFSCISVTQWQLYTPTMSATGFSLGNGTQEGAYRRVGDSLEVITRFIAGSGTNFGSGTFNWSLPTGFAIDPTKVIGSSLTGGPILGSAFLIDNDTPSNRRGGEVATVSGDATKVQLFPHGGFPACQFDSPFTWANADRIRIGCIVPIVQ